MRAYWKDGLRFETADKKFQAHVGGRIHIDGSNFTEGRAMKQEFGSFQNGSEFRRARVQVDGLIYGRVEYQIEYDFATGEAEAKDVYIGLNGIPYAGKMRVGQFKEPFSLEEVTSDNYTTFMERALPNALVPSRDMGVMATNAPFRDDRMTWAVGAFRSASDDFGTEQEDGGWAGTGRITGLPVWLDDGRSLVHLGASVSYRDPQGEAPRFRARPEAHQAPYVVDPGNFEADDVRFRRRVGRRPRPAWFQGEFIDTLTRGDGPQRNLYGYYVQAGWFLTELCV